ncbi:uncharacterized protein V6R79_007368 [Siganus canaliculatus]
MQTSPSPACSLPLDVSCHDLMAAFVFGTNYVRKSNRKICRAFPDTPNENGWLGSLNGTRHLTIYCLSPSGLRISSIQLHISPNGNEDVPSNGKRNACGQMEDILLQPVFHHSIMKAQFVDR